MKITHIQAFNELKKLGAPVYEHVEDCGNFSLDAEVPEADAWADYYSQRHDWMFGVSPRLDEILIKHNLHAEWVNPGRLSVYLA